MARRLLLDAGYTDCYRLRHPQQPGYTYPTDTPWMQLDYAFASPHLAAHLYTCEVVTGKPTAQAAGRYFPVLVGFR